MIKYAVCGLLAFAAGMFTVCLGADEAQLVLYDFEAGQDVAKYEGLGSSDAKLEIVAPGEGGDGHCIRLESLKPGAYAGLKVTRPIEVCRNLVLSFDHREEIEPGKQGQYLGVIITDSEGNEFWACDDFSNTWRHAEIAVGALKCSKGGAKMALGKKLVLFSLYGRTKDKTQALMKVWFDNITLSSRPRPSVLTDKSRESYSNPPFFNWPLAEGKQRLEYSMKPDLPKGETMSVEVERNFHTPDKPITAGTWYWRVWTDTPLSEGWSDIERVVVLPEAHKFPTQRIPLEALAKKSHPRLLAAALADERLCNEKPEVLLRRAEGIYKRGVQPHPGPYREGNPEWRGWIEWYGKVAGGVTGGTGRRLEDIAKIAMLTKDPKVAQWAKELALNACEWDPEGGSAMKLGDIGAHHLLRGLNNCYDACYDIMTPAEREKMKDTIVQRANQFYRSLNPFRGHEANNHAWLQALGVAESGIALLGDYDKAADWIEFVYELYVGRFLCCLGYQGDNNEGLGYWGYGLGFILEYGDMMKAVCGADIFQHPWLSQTARFPMYCAPPQAWGVSFADTGMPNCGVYGPTMTKLVRSLAVRTHDPYALWYSGEWKPVDGLAPRPPADLPQSIHYRHIGWVVFNTTVLDGLEAVTVAMHSGLYQAGHQHPDQNSFVINAYGEKLAIDGGYYDWYGSPHFKAYSAQTLAHNTILVDGKGQEAFKNGADGEVTAYFDSVGYGFTIADAAKPEIYQGRLKQFNRRILFIKPDFVIIQDEIASAKDPAKYDWLLHAVVPPQYDASKRSFSIERPGAALRGQFFAPQKLGMQVTKGFPVEPVNRYSADPVPPDKYQPEWWLTATPEQPGVSEDFLVAMQVQRLGKTAEPTATMEAVAAENAHGLRLKLGGQTHIVLFRKPGATGTLKGGGLETDGQVAAVELAPDGRVLRAFMQDAKSLRYDGKAVLESAKAATQTIPEVSSSKPLDTKTFLINGKPAQIAGCEQALADGALRVWWGEIALPESDFYDFTFDGWDGKTPLRVTWDGTSLEPALDKAPNYSAWLSEGPHYLTVTGRGMMTGLTIKGQGARPIPALMLPKEFKPPAGGLIIEAEKPSAEGDVKGKIVKKVGASGDLAHCSWDKDGQWAEWQFDAPKAGSYELLIRGAGEDDTVLREVLLDGKPLAPDVRIVKLAATGGWCRETDDWRYFAVTSPGNAPLKIALSEGKHTLRLQRVTGSMNIDLSALKPVE